MAPDVAAEDVAGCWQIDTDPWPAPWPHPHLWSPELLPKTIRLSLDPTHEIPFPGSYVPENALTVEVPQASPRFAFRYWIVDGPDVKMTSTSPTGQRLSAIPAGRDVLVGTLTSYNGEAEIFSMTPPSWTAGVTLNRIACPETEWKSITPARRGPSPAEIP